MNEEIKKGEDTKDKNNKEKEDKKEEKIVPIED